MGTDHPLSPRVVFRIQPFGRFASWKYLGALKKRSPTAQTQGVQSIYCMGRYALRITALARIRRTSKRRPAGLRPFHRARHRTPINPFHDQTKPGAGARAVGVDL